MQAFQAIANANRVRTGTVRATPANRAQGCGLRRPSLEDPSRRKPFTIQDDISSDYFAIGSSRLERSVDQPQRLRSQYDFNPGQSKGTGETLLPFSRPAASSSRRPPTTSSSRADGNRVRQAASWAGDGSHSSAGRVKLGVKEVQNAQAAGARGPTSSSTRANPGRTNVLSGNIVRRGRNPDSFRRFRSRSRPSTSASTLRRVPGRRVQNNRSGRS